MQDSEKNNRFLIFIIVLMLIIIAIYFIVVTYNENNNSSEEATMLVENEMSDDGYLLIKNNLNDGEAVTIDNVIKNENDEYILEGTFLNRYTITEEEYDYLRNGKALLVDSVEYYYTWSDEYNEYIYISDISDNIYYIEKDENSENYFVSLYGSDEYVYQETSTKIRVTVNKDVECEIQGGETETAERLFEEEEITYGTFTFEFKDGVCTKVFCNL